MKHSRFPLLASATLAVLPFMALIPGCGGGGGGSNSPTVTPTPASTTGALATYNLTSAAGDSAIALSYYQTAIKGTQTATKGSNTFTLSSTSPIVFRTGSRNFKFTLSNSTALRTGEVFVLGGSAPTATVSTSATKPLAGGSTTTDTYPGKSGQITITSLSATSITVRFANVVLEGPLTLNGTVTSKLP